MLGELLVALAPRLATHVPSKTNDPLYRRVQPSLQSQRKGD